VDLVQQQSTQKHCCIQPIIELTENSTWQQQRTNTSKQSIQNKLRNTFSLQQIRGLHSPGHVGLIGKGPVGQATFNFIQIRSTSTLSYLSRHIIPHISAHHLCTSITPSLYKLTIRTCFADRRTMLSDVNLLHPLSGTL